MKLKPLFVAIIAVVTISLAPAKEFTAAENQFVQELLAFRLSLRAYGSDDEVISSVQKYRAEHEKQIAAFGEEAQIVCKNMLATAEYNAYYAKNMHSPEMEGILRPQYERLTAYAAAHPIEKQNPWFTLTSADITNSMMQFLKQKEAMKLGLQEKKDYAMVLEKAPKMAFAHMLSGFWYYYAPGIGGGSKKKARQFFSDALKYAANDYERYYGNINLSQMNFEDKNKAEATRLLDEAEKILPRTRYIAFIRKINTLGYSLFDYNMNSTREKLDERMKETQ
ncbi:MAG: hypothetical protein IJS09_03055 [Treponema sp.]|nr:hypothetical protein [Treponema sp.]